ncbi:TetR family transcriptional regulator [Paenibacillus odorifer]|uniref:TetR/AcrR family transcriptional regulator n=1 Tax=Paenibacillus odorifer TaxID=189426 RepID=UPI00096E1064|nr:TetR/AcrR family transcriptional regulator [Paenibacillus odorifer]OME05316.1 TetR family transcriptional regulator [Paenibacillus odorifer]
MQSKKDEVKQEIESAALKVFFQKGFSDAKMNDIADEIQISVGNIYTYFKSAIVQEQITILTKYSRQIVIIFEKNKGTVYSNAKNELIDLMIETKRPYIKDHYKRYEIGTEENMILLKIIANNVINMILDLLKHEMSADSRKRIFEALSLYWLDGLKSLNE